MSVCHSVVPEYDESGENVNYQASSPDENALVRGAASQGFIFYKRTPDSMSVYAVISTFTTHFYA
jgi:phospholipid-transporting ATPase